MAVHSRESEVVNSERKPSSCNETSRSQTAYDPTEPTAGPTASSVMLREVADEWMGQNPMEIPLCNCDYHA